MKSLKRMLMAGGGAVALVAVTAAASGAQDRTDDVENITVSASRISIQGYEAPTPVTVIGAEILQRDAKVDIGDSIRELPAVGPSDSPGNGSNATHAAQGDSGMSTVNLRGLGTVRTLVLFDGQRVVTSNPNASTPPAIGGVDLSTIPSSVIKRVDVVTGGASAAWGSDAVAGVVNLVIDKTFTGVKGNLVYGNNSYDDHHSYKAELAAGTELLNGRAHTVFAATYTMSPDTIFTWNRPWYDSARRALYPCNVVNGGSSASLCHTPTGAYSTSFTNGGLITASAASATGSALSAIQALGGQFATAGSAGAAAANALRGTQFVGSGAQPVAFNYGVSSGSNCYSCSASPSSNLANAPIAAVPYHDLTLFNYSSFKVTPDIQASLMLNYGTHVETNQSANGRQTQVNIKVDNPFIPAALQQQMIARAIPSFSLGTAAMQNVTNISDVTQRNLGLTVGQPLVQSSRQLMRGVFTLTGAYSLLGEDWSWNAYAQNSAVRQRVSVPTNTLNQHFANAVDAVMVQASGPNSLGGGNPALAAQVRSVLTAANVPVPAVGTIACRSTLTATLYGITTNSAGNPTPQPGGLTAGCVPLNLFGDSNVSQAALDYIAPGRTNPGAVDRALFINNQAVFSISTQGQLPWGLPAGKPAVSLGFENRLEQQRNQRDPLGLGASASWAAGNFSQYGAQYTVQEGFLELDVPLVRNNLVEDLSFNAAGRITSYSTSGLVETWKLGLTSQITQDIKVRSTLSSDIRAPGVGELFSPPVIATFTLAYPPGGPNYSVKGIQIGNASLKPEQSTTVSGGIVLTPRWVDNLSLSFDWYSITLHNGIFAPTSAQILSQCATQHVANFCSLVFFARGWPGNSSLPVAAEVDGNGVSPGLSASLGTFPADAEGAVNAYLQAPVNANRETVSGLDFQMDYLHELFAGQMSWHLLGNYTDQKTRTSLGVTANGAGAVSGDGSLNPLTGFTQPKLRATLSGTYSEGDWSVTGQARVTGSARLTNNLTLAQSTYTSIDDNSVPAVAYGDVRGSYNFGDHIQIYGAIDNLFNAPPPNLGTIGGGNTSCILYDCIGRAYRIGVRFDN